MLVKALDRWPKSAPQPIPEAWLLDLERHGPLLGLGQTMVLRAEPGQGSPWSDEADTTWWSLWGLAPLTRLRQLTLVDVPLSQERFEALCGREDLSGLQGLTLRGCGMRDSWLPALIQALERPAGLESLTHLTLAEPGLSARGATLLASSPGLGRLKRLMMRECRLGAGGRRALGASPHLSDEAKAASGLPLLRSQVASAAADEAAQQVEPSAMFGELRSLLHAGPSEHGWWRLCDALDAAVRQTEQARVASQLMPYVVSSLSAWPESICVAPQAWVQEILDGREAAPGLGAAKTLIVEGALARVDAIKRLAQCEALRSVRRVVVRGEDKMSGTALGTLLDGVFGGSLRELELEGQSSATIPAALFKGRVHPSLSALSVQTKHLTHPKLDAADVERACSALKRLRLRGRMADGTHPGWLEAPWIQGLEALALVDLDRLTVERLPRASALAPASLRELDLGAVWDGWTSSLYGWLDSCERLEELRCGPSALENLGAVAPGVRRLTLAQHQAQLSIDQQTLSAWRRAPLLGLEALSLQSQRVWWGMELHQGRLLGLHSLMAASWARGISRLSLQDMMMTTMDLHDIFAHDAEPLARLSALHMENISWWAEEQRRPRALEGLAQAWLPSLRELTLSRSGVDHAVLDHVAATASWWDGVRRLSIKDVSTPGQADWRAAPWFEALPADLEHLDLCSVHEPMEALLTGLACSRAAASLRSLRLESCGLKGEGVAQLVQVLPALPKLERLDLSGSNSISMRAAHQLVAAPQLGQLSELKLHRSFLGKRATQAFLAAPQLSMSARASLFSLEDLERLRV